MSLLTLIDNIPLYSTIEEAEAWGSNFRIQGHHIHIYQGQTGYMSGASHQDIELSLNILGVDLTSTEALEGTIIPAQQTPVPEAPLQTLVPEASTEQTPTSTVEDFDSEELQSIVQPMTTTTTTTTTTTSGGSSGGGGGGGGY